MAWRAGCKNWSGAPVRLSPTENDAAHTLWVNGEDRYTVFNTQMEQAGAPPAVIEAVVNWVAFTRAMTYPHPQQIRLISPGDSVALGRTAASPRCTRPATVTGSLFSTMPMISFCCPAIMC